MPVRAQATPSGTMTPTNPTDAFVARLERFAAAVAAGDTERFAALFATDACYDDGFFGVHRGRAAIAAMLERFHAGGEAFAWQFIEPLADERIGYARYLFSYRSKQPESPGRLIVFEGMSRFAFGSDGLIADYAEVFDRGVAFVRLGYAEPRVAKLLARYAQPNERVRDHLTWRERTGG
ncbi:MAG: nuclear transport factor 2 family protein [Burkholderiaceae bacterium]|nr:MAG: nuclear transport factor 2 family protein [Burkholderiaceae bacterium]